MHRLLSDHNEKAIAHLKGAARRVIVSAPRNDYTDTVVVGVNRDILTAEDTIVSNASCTTNCLAPMTRAVDMSFPVKAGLMSTTHAASATQKVAVTFGGGKNRATLNNVIPASTGAAVAVGKVLPHLNGTALRVPTDTGSVVEAVYQIDGTPSKEETWVCPAESRDDQLRLITIYPSREYHRQRGQWLTYRWTISMTRTRPHRASRDPGAPRLGERLDP